MKYIGFIKEHNAIQESISFNDIVKVSNRNEGENRLILDYLNKGVLLLAWMGYFNDLKTNEPIIADSYYTDGEWIWPAYLQHYLKKYPQMPLDPDFIKYLKGKNYKFKIPDDFLRNKAKYEQEFSLKLNECG